MKLISVISLSFIASFWCNSAYAVNVQDASAYNAVDDTYYNGYETTSSIVNGDLSTNLSTSIMYGTSSLVANQSIPKITIAGSSSSPDYGNFTTATAFGYLYYYYKVIGSSGPVPVDIDYSMALATTNYGTATTSISIYQPLTTDDMEMLTAGQSAAAPVTQTLSGTIDTLASDTVATEVTLFASGTAYGLYTKGQSTFSAYVDPHIYIDPVYLAANPGVSLQISSGIGNTGPVAVAAVPEPATWLTMIGGLGIAGAAIRRRKALVAYTKLR